MPLSITAKNQLTEINRTITVLFPQFGSLSEYCKAIGFSEVQLKQLTWSQIEGFIDELADYLDRNNTHSRFSQLNNSMQLAETNLKGASELYAGDRKEGIAAKRGNIIRANSESQEKLDEAIKESLILKSNIESFVTAWLTERIGAPID